MLTFSFDCPGLDEKKRSVERVGACCIPLSMSLCGRIKKMQVSVLVSFEPKQSAKFSGTFSLHFSNEAFQTVAARVAKDVRKTISLTMATRPRGHDQFGKRGV